MSKRILITAAVIIVVIVGYGQWSMWDRYGVFNWWSAQPRFLKVNDRGYKQGIHPADPAPNYCLLDKAFPFDYPIVAATDSGIDGSACAFKGTPTVVYLRWKDQPWRPYVLLGAP